MMNSNPTSTHNFLPRGVENAQDSDIDPISPAQFTATNNDAATGGAVKSSKRWGVENSPTENTEPLPQTQVAATDSLSDTYANDAISKRDERGIHPMSPEYWNRHAASRCKHSSRIYPVTRALVGHHISEAHTQHSVPDVSAPLSPSNAGIDVRTLPHTSDNASARVSSSLPNSRPATQNQEPSESSVPILEARLVQDEQDEPVYNAIAVRASNAQNVDTPTSFCKQYQKYILVGLGSLVIGAMAMALGILVSSGQNSPTPYEGKVQQDQHRMKNRTYFADRENYICVDDPTIQADKLFETLEECCEEE